MNLLDWNVGYLLALCLEHVNLRLLVTYTVKESKPHADVVDPDETGVEATLPTSSTMHPQNTRDLVYVGTCHLLSYFSAWIPSWKRLPQ